MTYVQTYASFKELPSECLALFQPDGANCFFSGLPWFHNFVQNAMDEGDQVRIYHVGPAGDPGVVVAMRYHIGGEGPLRMRTLSSLSNFYTSLFGILGDEEKFTSAALELGRTISIESPRWDMVELKPLDIRSPSFAALAKGLESAGFVVQTYFCHGNWYLPTNGRNFAQYVETLPSALRNTLSRKTRRLERTGKARIEIITGGECLEQAIAAYEKIYLASWKNREPYPQFVPGLIRACANQGSLRFGLVHVHGEPAAAQIWIVHNGAALIYKLAYDERFAELSPGTILTAHLMEHVLDVDRVREVDYLTGDDKYKRDWMSHRRERWGILAINPRTVRGALAIARHIGGRAVKRSLKSLTSRLRRASAQS